MSNVPKTGDKRTERQEKLAGALRENLKRRKAAKRFAQGTEQGIDKEKDNG